MHLMHSHVHYVCKLDCTHTVYMYLFLPLLCALPVRALRDIMLNSTLIGGDLAYSRQRIVFTCVARNSTILEWQSNEHIGMDGDNIQIYSVGPRDNVTSVTILTTYATRVSVTMENGITVIVSQLFITASEQFPTSSITCRINGQGPIKTISFDTTGIHNNYSACIHHCHLI